MTTAYDASVEVGREIYRKEKAEKERQEYLEREREGHKAAARIWFNTLSEVWPPENNEKYWAKVTDKLSKLYNEYKDNELLMELLLMTHGYLGNVAEAADEVMKNGKQ